MVAAPARPLGAYAPQEIAPPFVFDPNAGPEREIPRSITCPGATRPMDDSALRAAAMEVRQRRYAAESNVVRVPAHVGRALVESMTGWRASA